MTGKIVKAVGGVFTVMCNNTGNVYTLFAPKKLRYSQQDILVGDDVTFSIIERKRGTVDSVLPRRNRMLRPEVANVDIAMIVIAPEPYPDLLLVDKIIINCYNQDIQPVIVINKCDLACEQFVSHIRENYEQHMHCHVVSAYSGHGLDELKGAIAGNTVCLAGQSAVGKTSLLNALVPTANKAVGELSAKTNRGRHTTRHSQIYAVHGGYFVDTTGFSMYELPDVEPSKLMLYYPELMEIAPECKYNMCTHTVEPIEDCAVQRAYNANKSRLPRYNRYLALHKELSNIGKYSEDEDDKY